MCIHTVHTHIPANATEQVQLVPLKQLWGLVCEAGWKMKNWRDMGKKALTLGSSLSFLLLEDSRNLNTTCKTKAVKRALLFRSKHALLHAFLESGLVAQIWRCSCSPLMLQPKQCTAWSPSYGFIYIYKKFLFITFILCVTVRRKSAGTGSLPFTIWVSGLNQRCQS